MASVILTADVGNTRTKFALLRQQGSSSLPETLATSFWTYDEPFDARKLARFAQDGADDVTACLKAGSHYGHLEEIIQDWPDCLPQPRVIRTASELPLNLQVDNPQQVGVDRVLNALAARHEFRGKPVIIIDTGTATTIDVVSSRGEFLGGAILPGYELSAHALHDYTNRLPLIPIQEIIGEIPSPLGKNTHTALRSGLIWGQVGAVREIVKRLQKELQESEPDEPAILLTGGAAELLRPLLDFPVIHRPQLTLQGLACCANCKS